MRLLASEDLGCGFKGTSLRPAAADACQGPSACTCRSESFPLYAYNLNTRVITQGSRYKRIDIDIHIGMDKGVDIDIGIGIGVGTDI